MTQYKILGCRRNKKKKSRRSGMFAFVRPSVRPSVPGASFGGGGGLGGPSPPRKKKKRKKRKKKKEKKREKKRKKKEGNYE